MKLWWLDVLEVDGDAAGDDACGAASVGVGAPTASTSAAVFDEARALIAMACADGAPDERERASVARFVTVDERAAWRVYRPREAGAPEGALAARRVLERMAQVALSDRDDGVLDDSERALLLTYARAYGVADDDVARLLAELADRRAGPFARLLATLAAAWPARRRRSSSASSSSSGPFVVRPREVR